MNYWARCVIYSFNWYFACFVVFLLTGQFEAGGIAGIMYGIGGECGIPEEWISCIMKRDWIEKLCDSFQNFVLLESKK